MKSLTPKQAEIKIASVFKGIDNSSTIITREQQKIRDLSSQARSLIPSLTMPAKPTKPVPVKAAPAAKAVKAPTAKVAAKAVKAPAVKATGKKPIVAGRPTMKDAIRTIVQENGGKVDRKDLHRLVTDKYGDWSRQMMYNVIKDSKHFKIDASGFVEIVAASPTAGDDTDQFIDQLETRASATATANVV